MNVGSPNMRFLYAVIALLCVVVVAEAMYILTPRSGPIAPQFTSIATTTTTDEMTILRVQDVSFGTGPKAEYGDTVTFSYIATLPSGKVAADTTNKPTTLVIDGADMKSAIALGLLGAQAGARRHVLIPPAYHYAPLSISGASDDMIVTLDISVMSVKKH